MQRTRWQSQNRMHIMGSKANDVTGLIRDWCRGDAKSLDLLLPLLYDDLRRVARGQMRREERDHVLQPTALVHEAYLRLVRMDRLSVEGRSHFLALAARLMRQILVDQARRKRALKRGGDETAVAIAPPKGGESERVDLLALDKALQELDAIDHRQRCLVEMKFFAGLTISEAATALGVSSATVEREWAVAKAWLYRRLSISPSP